MTITLSVLDGPRSDVRRPSFRNQPRPTDGAMLVVDHALGRRPGPSRAARPKPRARCPEQGGQRVVDVAGGTGIAAIPGAPRCRRIGAARRGAVVDWAVGDPEGHPVCVAVVRLRRVLARCDVRAAPPDRREGAAPHDDAAWPDRSAERDAEGLWVGWRTSSTASSRHRKRQRRASRQRHEVDRFANPREFRDFARHGYGPTSAAYRKLAGRRDRVAELDHAVVDLARDHKTRWRLMQWEYLLLTAHRAG